MHFTDTTGLKVGEIVISLVKVFLDRCWFISTDGVSMFIYTFLKFTFSFTYILFKTFIAGDDVNQVTCVACDVTYDVVCLTSG